MTLFSERLDNQSFIFKMLKLKVPQSFIFPTKAIWHVPQIQNLGHMLLVIMLSFVKLFVTLIEILVMHPWSRFTYTHKYNADSYNESCAKNAFPIHQNKYSIHLTSFVLSKVFICQKEVWGYVKKWETHDE